MDASSRQKLDDFRRALSAAINGSSEASRMLDELRQEGFSLYLLLDGSGDGVADGVAGHGGGQAGSIPRERALTPTSGGLPVRAGRGWDLAPERGSDRGPDRNLGPDPERPEREPAFLLTTGDVALLKAMGIDPTRKTRRRRNPR